MPRRPRRNHSPAFKAKVALEAIKGEEPLIQTAERYDVAAPVAALVGALRWAKGELGISNRMGLSTRLVNLIGRSRGRPAVDATTLEELRTHFRPEVETLSHLLGRDLMHWCDVVSEQ